MKFLNKLNVIVISVLVIIFFVQLGRTIMCLKETVDLQDQLITSQVILINAQDILIDAQERKIKTLTTEKSGYMTITGYSPCKNECDSDPLITSFMTKVRHGTVAVSRDLIEKGWRPGMKIYIEGLGVFTINDLMNKRYKQSIDIFCWSKEDALDISRTKRHTTLMEI